FLIKIGLLQTSDRRTIEFCAETVSAACPLIGPISTFSTASWSADQSRAAFYIGQIIILLATFGFALLIRLLTLATFDRCVGRVSERPRPAPRPPRTANQPFAPHFRPKDASHAVTTEAIGSP